ncbi:MAG: hypothetical protein JWP59_2987 [Massilia sp.]|nr:hypothetical protein [Massilia sp.]
MTPYRNLSGTSGIAAFAIKSESIHVRFKHGDTPNYLYDFASSGQQHVQAMQALALAGRGLSTYIARHVHDRYARRW